MPEASASKRRIRSNVGDVFTVPVDDERVAVGQILDWYARKGNYYLAIFDALLPSGPVSEVAIDEVLARPVVLLTIGLDGKLYRGHWPIVGHREPVEVDLPAYKVSRLSGKQPVYWAIDYTGKRTRRATREESDRLRYRSIYSAAAVERVVQGFFKVGPWDEDIDAMVYGTSPTSRELFGIEGVPQLPE